MIAARVVPVWKLQMTSIELDLVIDKIQDRVKFFLSSNTSSSILQQITDWFPAPSWARLGSTTWPVRGCRVATRLAVWFISIGYLELVFGGLCKSVSGKIWLLMCFATFENDLCMQEAGQLTVGWWLKLGWKRGSLWCSTRFMMKRNLTKTHERVMRQTCEMGESSMRKIQNYMLILKELRQQRRFKDVVRTA